MTRGNPSATHDGRYSQDTVVDVKCDTQRDNVPRSAYYHCTGRDGCVSTWEKELNVYVPAVKTSLTRNS